jgi:chemotaxis protein histidine kinase CheA
LSPPADTADSRFIAEVLPVFISEAQEQVETIEQLLLQLEAAPADAELLGALFRCAHTVKGSAGIFGLDAVVAFTHHVETLLDQLREGRLHFDAGLGTLLLRCNEQIRSLVAAAGGLAVAAAGEASVREALVLELQARGGGGGRPAAPAAPAPAAAAEAGVRWQVSAAFGRETFRNGSSTGGTQALEQVLTALPADSPGIAIVQHMPEKFTAMYAQRLDSLRAVNVREARDGDRLERGSVLIAPGGRHLKLRKAGGRTIEQDEASCVVFGMPMEAIKLQAVDKAMPLDRVAAAILQFDARG